MSKPKKKSTWTEEDVLKIMALMRTMETDSLNRMVGEEDSQTELGDILVDNGPTPDDIVIEHERTEILLKAVKQLKPREQMIIEMRYGLKDGKFRTLDECGAYFGVTRERIRQVEMRAIKKLKWIIRCKYKLKETDL